MFFNGIVASKGLAIGKVFHFEKQQIQMPTNKTMHPALEIQKLKDAIEKSKVALMALREKTAREIGLKESEIFSAHLLLLDDPEWLASIESYVLDEHYNVAMAVDETSKKFESLFLEMESDYMRARASDISDVGLRLIRCLLGHEQMLEIPSHSIVFCKDLDPSDAAVLNPKNVLGLVTEFGGETSHTAIIAKSLSIPALSGVGFGQIDAEVGDLIVLDAIDGKLITHPTQKELEAFKLQKEALTQQMAVYALKKSEAAITHDGVVIEVAANVAGVEGLEAAIEMGADGVGLFRTEFLYMNRSHPPSLEEQFNAYKKTVLAFGERPVIFRTFDIGGDKRIDYLELEEEMNPFLGYRAIRISLDKHVLFETQLTALLMASAFGNLKIMFPMIATIEEVIRVKSMLAAIKEKLSQKQIPFKDVAIGMMVEIPSVAVKAKQFAKHVDFFSIGTNDLLQYTVAVDRMNEKLTHLYSRYNPALLELIKQTAEAAKQSGIWIGICGEAAADPLLLPFYIAIGIDELSMSPNKIAEIKYRIRTLDSRDKSFDLACLMDKETPEEVMAYLETYSASEVVS